MPPLRSARRPARSTEDAPSQTISRPKRGKRGYRLFKNGSLNATPMGAEIAITKKNALDSPLLRLPPEIRGIIWEYTLAGYVIDFGQKQSLSDKSADRFNLLRVCRQTYVEVASLPRALVTMYFDFFSQFLKAADEGKLDAVEHVGFSEYQFGLKECLPEEIIDFFVPRAVLERLKSFQVTLYSYPQYDEARRIGDEKGLRICFPGMHLVVHHELWEEAW